MEGEEGALTAERGEGSTFEDVRKIGYVYFIKKKKKNLSPSKTTFQKSVV